MTIAITFVLKHPQKENKTHLHSLSSGVGAQSAAPGPSRKCRPLVQAVVLYL